MKTTIDIPDDVLQDAITLSKSRTKREAVICALTEYNRRQKMARLIDSFGTCDKMMDINDLMKSRKED